MLVQVIESQSSVVFLRHSVWNLLKASYRYFSVTYLNESQHLHLPARNMLKVYLVLRYIMLEILCLYGNVIVGILLA